ncbi:hypothetical protein LK494_03195 [Anaerovorax odorimutans]|nr:hypothetical protein [Anaerovorax odorimutans]
MANGNKHLSLLGAGGKGKDMNGIEQVNKLLQGLINRVIPQAITVTSNTDVAMTGEAGGGETFVPCNVVVAQAGDKLSPAAGKVRIGKGITKVRISAAIQLADISGTNTVYVIIRKNGGQIAPNARGYLYKRETASISAITMPEIIVPVAENDLIELRAQVTSDTGSALAGYTYMTVENAGGGGTT